MNLNDFVNIPEDIKHNDRFGIPETDNECCLNCGDKIGGNYTGSYRYSEWEEGKMCDICALHYDTR